MNNLLLCFVFNEVYQGHATEIFAVECVNTPLSSAKKIFKFMEKKYLKESIYHPNTYKVFGAQNSNKENVQVIDLPIKNFSGAEKMEKTIKHWVSYVQQQFPQVLVKERLDISESPSTIVSDLFETYCKLDEARTLKSSISEALVGNLPITPKKKI